jgi:Ca2+-binding EF-hand superfamily protein
MSIHRLSPVPLAACLFLAGCAAHRGDRVDAPVTRAEAPPARPAETATPPPSRPSWDRFFEIHDKNGDGQVTRSEYARGDDAFANLDRDKSGAVTRADFEVKVSMPADLAAPFLLVMRLAGPETESVAIGDFPELFESVDENKDGAIDRAEFAGPQPAQGSDRFGPVLAAADADRDGRLSLAELQAYAKARDRNDDGRLSRRERLKPGAEPKVGWFDPAARDPAPDFTLPRDADAGTVTLSSFAGKQPVALIFGSFT